MNALEWKRLLSKWKSRKPSDFVVIILIGVLFLIIAIPSESKNELHKEKQAQKKLEAIEKGAKESLPKNEDAYVGNAEKQLVTILESMEGVGKVKVMITRLDDGQVIVDKNLKISKDSKEEETVIYDVDDDTQPYVTSIQTPKIGGILVVAQGGDNAKVRADISEAIMALFDVEVHKIKIVKMSE